MQFQVVNRGKDGFDNLEAKYGRVAKQGLATIMLNAFESEIDSLMSFVDEPRSPAVIRSTLERYAMVEEIWEELQEQQQRIALKIDLLGGKVAAGGWNARSVLESSREQD